MIRGRVYRFGDNIDTDQIYPGRYLELTDEMEIAEHAMEDADPTFAKRFTRGGIIVAGRNFGCGSSREHAAITLKVIGVSLIIAQSFARIFYRNCLNLGLPLMVCKDVSFLEEGDEVEVDLRSGVVRNLSRGIEVRCEPLSDYAMRIIDSGGIKELIRRRLSEEQ